MRDTHGLKALIPTPPPWIVGHRGVAAEALENSLESLRLAVEQDADMIELDVQLTADGQLVAFHDWDLERLAGRPEIVEESELGSLRELVPSLVPLRSILDSLPLAMPLNVELKRRLASPDRFAGELARMLGTRPRILLSSFDWELLEATRAILPDRPLAPLSESEPAALLDAADRLSAWSVHCHHPLAEPDFVEAVHRSGRRLLTYTVNDAELARTLFAKGVSGVFTDAPGRLRTALGST